VRGLIQRILWRRDITWHSDGYTGKGSAQPVGYVYPGSVVMPCGWSHEGPDTDLAYYRHFMTEHAKGARRG